MLFRGISFAAGQAATPDYHSLFPSFPIPAPPQAVEAASTRALQPLDDFLEAGDAAAADFQRLGAVAQDRVDVAVGLAAQFDQLVARGSEEHTSELQSLMRHSYAVFCLKKKKEN